MVVLFAVLPKIGFAQRNPNHYSTEQGLSNNFVYCVFKDSRGVLWAATQSGLNCFNGNEWEYFDAETGQVGEEFNDYTFMGIAEDEDKNIYFCTYGQGVFVYNFESKGVRKMSKETNPQLTSNQFLNIGYRKNKIYLLAYNSVHIINSKTGKWQKNLLESKQDRYSYLDILIEKDTINILASGIGIQQFVNDQLVNTIDLQETAVSLQELERWGNKYIVASANGIYISQQNKLIKQAVFLEKMNISNEDFLGLGTLQSNYYCISTTYGKLDIDSMANNKIYLSANKQNKSFIKEGSFISNFSDKANNAVVVGMQSGIGYLENTQKKFTHYEIKGEMKSAVLCTYPLNDSIVLLGTQKGLLIYNKNNYLTTLLNNSLGNNFVYDIIKIKNKIIICSSNGLYCFDQNKITTNLPKALYSINRKPIRSINILSDSLALIINISDNVIHLWNTKNDMIVTQKILGNSISNVAIKNTILYYTANNGLFFYDLQSKINREIICNLPSKDFRNIHLVHNKLFVVLSMEGVFEISQAGMLNLALPIKNKIVGSALVDNKIVITTNKNIIEFESNKTIYNVPSVGYSNNGFSDLAINVFGNHVFFGQEDGFSILDNTILKTERRSNLIIVNNIVYYKNGTYHINQNTDFSFNQNTIILHLACTNYLEPDRNKIWYRINGQEWIDLGVNKQLLLNQLAPDDYHIELMLDTVLNVKTKPTIYEFTILPPWYKTWWFKLLLAFASVAILFFGTKYYFDSELQKKQLQIEKLEAVQNERERMSADLHDDIGSHISTVQLLANKISENTSNEYVTEFKTTVNQLGQKIREIIWVTKSENDTLENFILYTRQYIAKQMDLADILLTIHIPDAIPDIVMPSAMRRDVYLCIKECINNIVKHADAGRVDVEIAISNQQITITIQDDGKGILASNTFGNGLKTMHTRLEKHGGGYELISDKGCKSVIRFEV
jgi:signal transduction histidine kinase